MLARLLRSIFVFQFITGMLLSGWLALGMQAQWGKAAFALVPLGGLSWIVLWQAVIIGYSMLKSRPTGAWLAWLRAAWGEFMAALLTCDMDSTDKVVKNISDCREQGI